MATVLGTLDRQTVRALDGLAVFWVVLWLVVGVWTGATMWQLSHLGDTVADSGRALDDAGRAVEAVADVPLVGDQASELAARVRATASDVQTQGEESRDAVRRLSVLLGLSVAVIPTTPLLGVYAPLRLARARDAAAVRRALDSGAPGLDAHLATRAVRHLPLPRLLAVTDDPVRDLRDRRFRALADAELRRLGLGRPAPPAARD